MTFDKLRGAVPALGTLVLALHGVGCTPGLSLDDPDAGAGADGEPLTELDADTADAAAEDAGIPIVLAGSLASPRGLVLDDGAAYVLARPTGDGPQGQLLRIDRDSGVITVLSATNRPTSLAADKEFLYWTELEAGKVRRVNKLGQAAATLGSDQPDPRHLAVGEGGIVVWTAGAVVLRAAVGGSGNQQLAHLDAPATGVVIDGPDVLVSVDTGDLWRVPLDASDAPERLITGERFARGLISDGHHLYWLDTTDGAIKRAPRSGGLAQVVAAVPSGRGFVTLSADHVIWTDHEAGVVRRVPKAGGAIETLASSLSLPAEIAAFEDWIVWVNRADGSVMALRQ